MDVTTVEQAKIAEESGAVAVMALERVPADIRKHGGVARMADPEIIQQIMDALSIPVMAKARIGHFVEAQALEALGVDMIDESEVLTPADPFYQIRTKGEAGTGNIIEAVRHQHMVNRMIHQLQVMNETQIHNLAQTYIQSYFNSFKELTNSEIKNETVLFGDSTYTVIKQEMIDLIYEVKNMKRLPVVNFAAGGIATPADAAMMMQMGSDGVFVGSGIFKSKNPEKRAKAIVESIAHYDDPKVITETSKNLGEAMVGINIDEIPLEQRLQERGW
jgi:pyridoxal 5'-phosphate synthase pdxS subunit